MKHSLQVAAAVALVLGQVVLPGQIRNASAQEAERVFLEADSVATTLVDGRMVSELVNARFSQGGTELRADRARDEGGDLVLFRGHVVIVQDADTVRADLVRYDQSTGVGHAEGNVEMTDGDVRLRSSSARHNTRSGETFFEDPVQFEDSLGVLFAERGVYARRADRAAFAGRVWLERADVLMGADSISVSRERDVAWATGRVGIVLVDTTGTETARMFADSLRRDGSSGVTDLAGRIVIARFGAEPADTLLVAAERARFGDGRMTAVDSVVVAAESGALRSDSMVVVDGALGQQRRFFGGVQAWYEGVQVTSDSLFAEPFTADPDLLAEKDGPAGLEGQAEGDGEAAVAGGADSLKAFGSVFVARHSGSPSGEAGSNTPRIDQMKGRFLHAVTRREELTSMRLFPNAEVILYVEDDEAGRTLAFDALSDTVFVALKGGEPTEVLFLGETAGTEYTENLFEQVRDLPGYVWVPHRQPDRERLRDRMRGLSAERIDGRKRLQAADSRQQD